MTDEIDTLERRRLEPTAKPRRQLSGRKPRPEPWQVEHVDAATFSKRLEYRLPPAPRAGQPVYEDDGCALADDPIPRCRPVDHELPDLHEGSVWQRSEQGAPALKAVHELPGQRL